MTRKSITTAHTVVSCDVCGRTLLRGEHAETFIAGGGRRTVCELCTPRAAHEGWLREGLDDIVVRRDVRSRSRSLLGRIRQRREDVAAHEGDPADPAHDAMAPEPRDVHAVPTNAELKLARAAELFNASEHARTIAGVSRSLGDPMVSMRPSATEGAVVSIVVGWEITWYRFEVDLGNEAAGVRQTDQGSELAELDPSDQRANAVAAPDGSIRVRGA